MTSETIEQVFERCTSTDFSSLDRSEIIKAMQEYSSIQVNDTLDKILKELRDHKKLQGLEIIAITKMVRIIESLKN